MHLSPSTVQEIDACAEATAEKIVRLYPTELPSRRAVEGIRQLFRVELRRAHRRRSRPSAGSAGWTEAQLDAHRQQVMTERIETMVEVFGWRVARAWRSLLLQ